MSLLSLFHPILLTAQETIQDIPIVEGGSVAEQIFDIMKPVAITAVSSLPVFVGKYGKKALTSFEAKNELDSLCKVNETKTTILKEVETIVNSAVGSNMQLADKMKENGEKLSEDQIKALKESTKKMIYASLPASLTEEDGVLLNIVGGQDKLDTIIENMREKAVYDYKINKNKNATKKDETYTVVEEAPVEMIEPQYEEELDENGIPG